MWTCHYAYRPIFGSILSRVYAQDTYRYIENFVANLTEWDVFVLLLSISTIPWLFWVIIYNLINWVVLMLLLPILFYFLVVLQVSEVYYMVHYITIDSVLINDVWWLISGRVSLSGRWSFWHGCLSIVMHRTSCSCQLFDWSTTNSPRLWLYSNWTRAPSHELLTPANRTILIAGQPFTSLINGDNRTCHSCYIEESGSVQTCSTNVLCGSGTVDRFANGQMQRALGRRCLCTQ